MARIRLNSDATVRWTREEVAASHAGDFPAESLLDWGNGYVVASVDFLDATPPEPEPEPEVKSKSQAKRIAVQKKPRKAEKAEEAPEDK